MHAWAWGGGEEKEGCKKGWIKESDKWRAKKRKGVGVRREGRGGKRGPRHRISELFRFADNFEVFDHYVLSKFTGKFFVV